MQLYSYLFFDSRRKASLSNSPSSSPVSSPKLSHRGGSSSAPSHSPSATPPSSPGLMTSTPWKSRLHTIKNSFLGSPRFHRRKMQGIPYPNAACAGECDCDLDSLAGDFTGWHPYFQGAACSLLEQNVASKTWTQYPDDVSFDTQLSWSYPGMIACHFVLSALNCLEILCHWDWLLKIFELFRMPLMKVLWHGKTLSFIKDIILKKVKKEKYEAYFKSEVFSKTSCIVIFTKMCNAVIEFPVTKCILLENFLYDLYRFACVFVRFLLFIFLQVGDFCSPHVQGLLIMFFKNFVC